MNQLWGGVLVDELVRCGVHEAIICPGSRSTPLVLALAEREDVCCRSVLDERSAAFFALGIAKATRRPVAVVTTSGTAVANLLPAAVEAFQSHAPLVLLTADRPHRLRGTEANQTIDQGRVFGSFARLFVDLPMPAAEVGELESLRVIVDRALSAALGPPAGPVHLNVPIDKPLEPTPVPGAVPAGIEREVVVTGRSRGAPWLDLARPPLALAEADLARLASVLADAPRGVIVAGPVEEPTRVGPALVALARSTGHPLIAEPLSGARFAAGARGLTLAHADLFLRPAAMRARLRPDIIIRVGASPTSAAVGRFIEEHRDVRQLIIGPRARTPEHVGQRTEVLAADAALTCTALSAGMYECADKAYAAAWRDAEQRTGAVLRRADVPSFEGALASEVVSATPAGGTLFLSNSGPVRDADTFAPARNEDVRVLGNRGASGIDGIVSTILGVAASSEAPVVGLLGDLALLHDAPALAGIMKHQIAPVLVVVNNDGGGLFHRLPIARFEPEFTEFFVAPHRLDLAKVAAAFGVPHARAEVGDVGGRVREAIATGRPLLVEVASDRAQNQRVHEEISAAVAAVFKGGRA